MVKYDLYKRRVFATMGNYQTKWEHVATYKELKTLLSCCNRSRTFVIKNCFTRYKVVKNDLYTHELTLHKGKWRL